MADSRWARGAAGILAALVMVGCGGPNLQSWWSLHTQCPLTVYFDLAWSPDGSEIAFTSDPNAGYSSAPNIYVLDVANPQHVRQLTQNGTSAHVRWSPDGHSLIYVDSSANMDQIDRITADGASTSVVGPLGYGFPAVSPDGITVAAEVRLHGQPAIALISPGGAKPQVLTQPGRSPDWSPDGARLVFEYGPLFVLDRDGANRTQLTGDGLHSSPVWSPDGARIAYVGHNPAITNPAIGEITILELATNKITPVAKGLSPSWSPDGKRLAFISQSAEWQDIALINADGTGLTQLTHNPTGGVCLH